MPSFPEKRASREDLEQERIMLQQEMERLEKQRSKRQSVMKRIKSNKIIVKDADPTVSTACTTESHSDESLCNKCQVCCRKDRIIRRQLHEIQQLRQQLQEAQQPPVPPQMVLWSDDEGSEVSGVTHLFESTLDVSDKQRV